MAGDHYGVDEALQYVAATQPQPLSATAVDVAARYGTLGVHAIPHGGSLAAEATAPPPNSGPAERNPDAAAIQPAAGDVGHRLGTQPTHGEPRRVAVQPSGGEGDTINLPRPQPAAAGGGGGQTIHDGTVSVPHRAAAGLATSSPGQRRAPAGPAAAAAASDTLPPDMVAGAAAAAVAFESPDDMLLLLAGQLPESAPDASIMATAMDVEVGAVGEGLPAAAGERPSGGADRGRAAVAASGAPTALGGAVEEASFSEPRCGVPAGEDRDGVPGGALSLRAAAAPVPAASSGGRSAAVDDGGMAAPLPAAPHLARHLGIVVGGGATDAVTNVAARQQGAQGPALVAAPVAAPDGTWAVLRYQRACEQKGGRWAERQQWCSCGG